MTPDWFTLIEAALGRAPVRATALGGGCIDEVYRLEMAGGDSLVAKLGGAGGRLALEGFMLRYLAAHGPLPVPRVLHAADELLVMEFLPGASRLDGGAERHAAELVAGLHEVSNERFGFELEYFGFGDLSGGHKFGNDVSVFQGFFTAFRCGQPTAITPEWCVLGRI